MKNEHELKRCVFTELTMIRRIHECDYGHMDPLCTQLYMDILGYGINTEVVKWTTN